jgi:hypothetical protein
MPPVFGDFLAQASGHVSAAVSVGGELPDTAKTAAICELGRLVTTLARYLADLPLPGEYPPIPPADSTGNGTRAALDARIALRRSAQVLRSAAAPLNDIPGDGAYPAVRHLASAATALAAGRDLLHTHAGTGPTTAPARGSSWASVLHSPRVTGALLGEIATLAGTLAPWMMRLSLQSPPGSAMPAAAGLTLHEASRWLWTAGLKLETRTRQHPPGEDARLVLNAIPANLPPARPPVTADESLPSRCRGILTTAARMEYAAAAFTRTARWSAQATSISWQRDALAAAIIADSSVIILRALAHRASSLGLDPGIQAHLGHSAQALQLACTTWRAVTGEWGQLSTGTTPRAGTSTVAAEMSDLVLQIGRIVYANPGWALARGSASHPRDPADLAPAARDLRTVLTAIHHTAGTLARLAAADRRCVRRAAAEHRLYIATRLLPAGHDVPYPYSPAPAPASPACWTATTSPSRPAPTPPALSMLLPSPPGPHPASCPPPTPRLQPPRHTGHHHQGSCQPDSYASPTRQAHRQQQSPAPATWNRQSAVSTSPNQPCCSALPASTTPAASSSPKQPPRQTTKPPATTKCALLLALIHRLTYPAAGQSRPLDP